MTIVLFLYFAEGQFQQVSFVNAIATSKGGSHVNYVTDPLVQAVLKKVNTKNKGGMELKAHHVKYVLETNHYNTSVKVSVFFIYF